MKTRYPTAFGELQSWAAESGVPLAEARVRFAQYAILRAIVSSRRLSGILVFKGGNALDFVWQPNRSTRDLDFSADMDMLHDSLDVYSLKQALAPTLNASSHLLGIALRIHSVEQQPKGPGKTFITYEIRVGYALQDQIALREKMEKGHPSPHVIPIEISINEPICADTTVDINGPNPLRVSTIEDIVSEKLRALLQQTIRNRNRSQDLLDIAVIVQKKLSLDLGKVARFLEIKSAARLVPLSRAAFKDPEVIARASEGYDSLQLTTRDLFIPLAQAQVLLYQLIENLDIIDS